MTKPKQKNVPPVAFRFIKGQSGFPAGRPKDAPSEKSITRKVALKRYRVKLDGKMQYASLLELVIIKLRAMAMSGKPSAVDEFNKLRDFLQPLAEDGHGFLIVPETLTSEEFKEMAKNQNAEAMDPTSPEYEIASKALEAGMPPPQYVEIESDLGRALAEFIIKWKFSPTDRYAIASRDPTGRRDAPLPS